MEVAVSENTLGHGRRRTGEVDAGDWGMGR